MKANRLQQTITSNGRSIVTFFGIFIVIGILTGTASCGNGNGGKTDSTGTSGSGGNREDLLKIIEGGWVNTEYIESLKKVHSPMFAAEAGRPVQDMYFDIKNVKGDTVYNGSGRLNNLDGDRFDVVFYQDKGVTKMRIEEGTSVSADKPKLLEFSITEGDTVLKLIDQVSNGVTIFRRQFRTAPKRGELMVSSIEYFVNAALFEGEWKSTDGKAVSFDANGHVTGWDKWTWYNVEVDKYGVEVMPDIMSVYNDKGGATYVYTLDNDHLAVYEYNAKGEDGTWSRGALIAEFDRVK